MRKLILFIFFIIIGLHYTVAQKVDVKSRMEYSQEESGVSDINSITIPVKRIKKAKKEEGISIDDLQRVVKNRRATRYRKVRNENEKCFKDVVEDESCDKKTKDIEKHLPKKK